MEKKLYQMLLEETEEMEKLSAKIGRELKRFPQGRLEVRLTKGKYTQYIHVQQKENNIKRSYIRKRNHKLAEQLAQKAYEIKMREVVNRRRRALKESIGVLKSNDCSAVYLEETAARQALITPLIPTDEQYIEQWYQEHPGDRNSYVKTTAYTTIRGETVRSKSEKMIADAYYMAGVPYVYEPTVILPNGRTRYPDFAVLNVRLRRTYYHEHFGMMDDEEYRQNAILRMREYNKNGFPVGEQMIVTFEGENIPFDQEELAEIIQAYLQ